MYADHFLRRELEVAGHLVEVRSEVATVDHGNVELPGAVRCGGSRPKDEILEQTPDSVVTGFCTVEFDEQRVIRRDDAGNR
jgi:hypothetical protein